MGGLSALSWWCGEQIRFDNRLSDPRLAIARLPRNQHDLAFAPPGVALAFQQEINFILAADEISHLRQPDSLEAALSIRYAPKSPTRGSDRQYP